MIRNQYNARIFQVPLDIPESFRGAGKWTVTLEIDVIAVALALGRKAARNRSRKSRLDIGIKAQVRPRAD